MSSVVFILILFSGLMHALYNLLIKQSRNKTVFIWWLFFCSTVLFTAALPFLPGRFPQLDSQIVFTAIGGAFCFVLYHLFTGLAYRSGDLSVTYPLSQTAMLYVPLWGIWLLDEQPSQIALCGIIVVMLGAYLLPMKQITLVALIRPLGNLVNYSVLAALAAGFIYSLGAIIDKTGVTRYHPLYFTYILVIAMLAIMSINLLRSCHRTLIFSEWRENHRLILAGGPLMMGSFLSFRYALALAPMSYVVPARQISILIGVLIGVLFLKESFGRIRFIASILIFTGICLIRLG